MLSWPSALTLAERLAGLRAKNCSTSEVDLAAAQNRLKRWRKEKVFADQEALFQDRLAADNISESQFLALLGTPPSALVNRDSLPEWASSMTNNCHGAPLNPILEQAIQEFEKTTGRHAQFLLAAAGFISAAQKILQAGIERLQQRVAQLPFNPQTIEKVLLRNILGLLSGMMNRTLVLELNVARIQGQLQGESPEERFTSFIDRLSNDRLSNPGNVNALWEEYPVLARQLVLSLEQWAGNSIEFLERLADDWLEIQEQFNPEAPGSLINLRTGAGDRHNNGHSVSIAEFESGLHLVYKPRSLAVDRQFQRLLEWINARRPDLAFRTLDIIEKQHHGWVGYVDSHPCDSEEEIRRFYQRQGGYLAILYMVHATDFHFENLIACGEDPVLVDLESLFHPNLFPPNDAGKDPLFFAYEELSNSVFRIGLLPFRFAVNEEQQEGVEISGLGGAGKQKTPYPVGAWEGVATDEMRFVRKRVEMPPQRNRPRLQNAEVNALDYQHEIISGFADIYKLLEQNRSELLAPDSPLAPFADLPVRCIARPTQVYGSLLTESYHPNLLRDALDRERLFDNLWSETDKNPVLKRLISYERADLWRNDVPVFTARPASSHLWSSTNDVIPDCLHQTPLSLVQTRLQQMGADDLKRQTWFIRAAMTALAMEEPSPARPSSQSTLRGSEADPADFLEMAIAAGDYLVDSAIRGAADGVAWIGLDSVLERFWELTPTGMDLYNGIPGIALFLAYLGEITGERRFKTIAEEATQTVLKGLGKFKPQAETPVGAFTGEGSLIYFLTHCGVLWDRPELLAEAEKRAHSLSSRISNDKSFDVISGSAGLIAVLLALHQHCASTQTLELAVQCGDHLLQHAQQTAQGKGWITLSNSAAPLTGFSHGAAGIAWALMKLAGATGELRFREAAITALQYERSLFSPAQNNWPDLRAARLEDQAVPYAIAWCHGAPGIGLGRTLMLEHYEDQEIYAEITAAVQATLSRNLGINYSLCHGDLGNYETLQQAMPFVQNSAVSERIRLLPSHILAGIREHGWRCGVPLGVETPGLMVGVAGIGYGLLRIARPMQAPSVLALAAPVGH
jgi:type 2 lantibiotic biosynthesis protein LanM